MQKIDLKKIIEGQGLKPQELAAHLFPAHKFPALALGRLLEGKSILDAEQISRLSQYTGIPIASLYTGGEWEIITAENKIVFNSGDYVAELDTKKWGTKIYHNKTIFHEVILHQKGIALSEYLNEISNLIIKHSKP